MYIIILENELSALFEDIFLRERDELIFQHDAPVHFSRQVRNVLHVLSGRWVEVAQSFNRPWSPDLNVLNYFVWSHIKNLVEHIRRIKAEMREAILAAFITTEMAHRAMRNITRRVEICLRERGKHFEQFLH